MPQLVRHGKQRHVIECRNVPPKMTRTPSSGWHRVGRGVQMGPSPTWQAGMCIPLSLFVITLPADRPWHHKRHSGDALLRAPGHGWFAEMA